MILAGQSNTVCLTFMRQTWGVSRAQGYRLLKKAWAQIKDDIDGGFLIQRLEEMGAIFEIIQINNRGLNESLSERLLTRLVSTLYLPKK